LIKDKKIDFGKIVDVAIKIVEGGRDEISAPGQCLVALDPCSGLKDSKRASYLEPEAGY
jgi:poly(3-hydroxybutyrate) depolymerase